MNYFKLVFFLSSILITSCDYDKMYQKFAKDSCECVNSELNKKHKDLKAVIVDYYMTYCLEDSVVAKGIRTELLDVYVKDAEDLASKEKQALPVLLFETTFYGCLVSVDEKNSWIDLNRELDKMDRLIGALDKQNNEVATILSKKTLYDWRKKLLLAN